MDVKRLQTRIENDFALANTNNLGLPPRLAFHTLYSYTISIEVLSHGLSSYESDMLYGLEQKCWEKLIEED